MVIKQLNTIARNMVAEFDYSEILCILNAMYQVSRFEDVEKDKNFNEVYAKIMQVHALLKHGDIPEWELEQMYRLTIGNRLPEEEYDG